MFKFFLCLFFIFFPHLSFSDSVFLILKHVGRYGGQISVAEISDFKTCQVLKNMIIENEGGKRMFTKQLGVCIIITDKQKNELDIIHE